MGDLLLAGWQEQYNSHLTPMTFTKEQRKEWYNRTRTIRNEYRRENYWQKKCLVKNKTSNDKLFKEKVKEIYNDFNFSYNLTKQRRNDFVFVDKAAENFTDNDYTCLFTLKGNEYNQAKHTKLIPYKNARKKLEYELGKIRKRLGSCFKYSITPHLKQNLENNTWRLHFHLIINQPTIFKGHWQGESIQLKDLGGVEEHAKYLTRHFSLSLKNNIRCYSFSSNCKSIVKKKPNLYWLDKKHTKNKEKVLSKDFYYSSLFQPISNIQVHCRSP